MKKFIKLLLIIIFLPITLPVWILATTLWCVLMGFENGINESFRLFNRTVLLDKNAKQV